jgi:hypothetical protein
MEEFAALCATLCGCDLAEWLERLAVNAKVATDLGSIPASSDTVESEGAADEAVLNNVHKKIPLLTL